jgi:hypothetical protein
LTFRVKVIYSSYIHTKGVPKSAGALGPPFIFLFVFDERADIEHIVIVDSSELLVERRRKSLIWKEDFEESIFFYQIVYEDFKIPITRNQENLIELISFIDDFCEHMKYEITINISFFCGLHLINLMLEYDDISELLKSSIETHIIILDISEKIINA